KPPPRPAPPAPPRARLWSSVQFAISRAEPLASKSNVLFATAPPVPSAASPPTPVPPTAWLYENVLPVRVIVPPWLLLGAPPRAPLVKTEAPVPGALPVPPTAWLDTNTLSVIVAAEDAFGFWKAPPAPLPVAAASRAVPPTL